jgi:antitoxin ParD1/3/4
MPHTLTLQVTVSEETLDFVKKKLQTGDYSSEGEVIDEIVTSARENEAELEQWLREVAVPAYKNHLADPSTGIPLEQVKAELAEDLKNFQENHEWS